MVNPPEGSGLASRPSSIALHSEALDPLQWLARMSALLGLVDSPGVKAHIIT